MKIVFCTQNLAPFRMKWMDELAKYSDVIIYHLNQYEIGLNRKYISYYPQRAIVNCKKRKFLWGLEGYFEKDIIDENADVYLLDGYGFWGQQHLIFTLWRKKIPFIISCDGGFINTNESTIKKQIKRFFLSKANAYFSTSKETDKFIEYYGGKGIKYRHFFSNITKEYVENEPPSIEKKYRLRKELHIDSKFIIVSVGKFEQGKGFDLLLKALEDEECIASAYFIGGSNIEIYEEFINDKNRHKIHFIDFCNPQMLKKYYMAADLAIFPTRYDIWGLVVSEAMANGIPVVTTDHCLAGVAMLEKNEIIPVEDTKAIGKQIIKFINMEEKEKWEIGMRNIRKVVPYLIENATRSDIVYLEKFSNKNNKRNKE